MRAKKLIYNKNPGFSLIWAMFLLSAVSITMAASIPFITKKSDTDTNTSKYTYECVVGENAADPDSVACTGAIKGCAEGIEKDCNTLFSYADTYQAATYKIAREVCDDGGTKACKFLMDECVANTDNCDIDGSNDISYYMNLDKTVENDGREYIESLGAAYYDQGLVNFKGKADNLCNSEFDTNQTMNTTACVLLGRQGKTHTYTFATNKRKFFNEENSTNGTTFDSNAIKLDYDTPEVLVH